MSELIRWEDNGNGGWLGYAGTLPDWFCQIWRPDLSDDEWVLQRSAMAGRVGKVCRGSGPDELKARAEELLREFASSIGAVFPEPAEPLTQDDMACEWTVDDAVSGGSIDCGRLSRYRVERSDHDGSFYPDPENRPGQEACDIHLADTAVALIGGDGSVAAVVQVRWDA